MENNSADTITVNALTVLGSDSTLVAEQDIVQVRLPLKPDQKQSTFIFDSELGIDTLILSYQTSARLVSEDCGIETVYANLDYIRNDFDSINVVNKVLIEDVTEDVKIYN